MATIADDFQTRWWALEQKLVDKFGKKPDVEAVLFLIGLQETGFIREKISKEAGLKEVYIIKASELSEDEQKQFIIKDNISGGEWDWDMLRMEWDIQELDEWGLDVPDFGDELEAVEDEFASPDGGIETDIVLGDLFEIGQHRLLCGDSTQTDTFERLLGLTP